MTRPSCVDISPDSVFSRRPEYSHDVLTLEENNVLVFFLGKRVDIKSGDVQVHAKLLWFEGGGIGRGPQTLLIQSADGRRHILSSWTVITKEEGVMF